jgi:hypothetical protein
MHHLVDLLDFSRSILHYVWPFLISFGMSKSRAGSLGSAGGRVYFFLIFLIFIFFLLFSAETCRHPAAAE